MADDFVRDPDDTEYERLKARAAGNNRSLEAELPALLIKASKQVGVATARAEAESMRRRLKGRAHSDSASLIGEDRGR